MSNFETTPPPRPLPSGPRQLLAGDGWQWIAAAFRLVREQPVTWILLALVYLVIHIGVSMIPLIGGVLPLLLSPVFAGGFILAAKKAESGGELELSDLFAGFRDQPKPLLGVALVYLALCMLAVVVMMALIMLLSAMGLVVMPVEGEPVSVLMGLMMLLVFGVPMFIVSMAYWFAPALVVLDGMAPFTACRTSLSAGMRNWKALLVCGLMLGVLLLLAMLPFFLGLLLWFPVMYVTSYTSWKAVFGG
jgi:uncharacterized membrane protein